MSSSNKFTATAFYIRYIKFLQTHKPLYIPPWYLDYLPETFHKRTRCGYGIFNFVFGFHWFKRFRFFDLQKSTYIYSNRKRKNITLWSSIQRERYLLAIYKKSAIFNKKVFSVYFSNSFKYLFFIYRSQKLKNFLQSDTTIRNLLYFNDTSLHAVKFQSSFIYFFFQNNVLTTTLFKNIFSNLNVSLWPPIFLSTTSLNTRLRGSLTDVFNDYSNFDIFENIVGDDEGSDAPTSHRRIFEEMYDGAFVFFFRFFLTFMLLSLLDIFMLMLFFNFCFGAFSQFFYLIFFNFLTSNALGFFFYDLFFLQPTWNGFFYYSSSEMHKTIFVFFLLFFFIWAYFTIFIVFADFLFFVRQRSDYYQGLEAFEIFSEPETSEEFDPVYEAGERDILDYDTFVEKSEQEFDFLEPRPTLLYYNSLISDPLPHTIFLHRQAKLPFDSVDLTEEISMRGFDEDEDDGDDFYFDVLGYHLIRPLKFAFLFFNYGLSWIVLLPLYVFFTFFLDFLSFFIYFICNLSYFCVQICFYTQTQTLESTEFLGYHEYIWHYYVLLFYLLLVSFAVFFIFTEFNVRAFDRSKVKSRLSEIFEILLFKSTYNFSPNANFWLFNKIRCAHFTTTVPQRIQNWIIFFKYIVGCFYISQRTITNAAVWNTNLSKKWSIYYHLPAFIQKAVLYLVYIVMLCILCLFLIFILLQFMPFFSCFDTLLSTLFNFLISIWSILLFSCAHFSTKFLIYVLFFKIWLHICSNFLILMCVKPLYILFFFLFHSVCVLSIFSWYVFFYLFLLNLFSIIMLSLCSLYFNIWVLSCYFLLYFFLFFFKIVSLFLFLVLSNFDIFSFLLLFLLYSKQICFLFFMITSLCLLGACFYLFMQSLSHTFEFFLNNWILYQKRYGFHRKSNFIFFFTSIVNQLKLNASQPQDVMDYYKQKHRVHKRLKLRKKNFRYQFDKYLEKNISMFLVYVKFYGYFFGVVNFILRRLRFFFYVTLQFFVKIFRNQEIFFKLIQRTMRGSAAIKSNSVRHRQFIANLVNFFNFKHHKYFINQARAQHFTHFNVLYGDFANFAVAKQLYNSMVEFNLGFNFYKKPEFKTESLYLFYLRTRWVFLWSYNKKADILFSIKENSTIAGRLFLLINKMNGFFDHLRFRFLISRYFFMDEFFIKLLFTEFNNSGYNSFGVTPQPRFKSFLTKHSVDVAFPASAKASHEFEPSFFSRQNFTFFLSYVQPRVNYYSFIGAVVPNRILSMINSNAFLIKYGSAGVTSFARLRAAFSYQHPRPFLSTHERHVSFMKSIYGENADLFRDEDHSMPFAIYLKNNFGFFIFGAFFMQHWVGPTVMESKPISAEKSAHTQSEVTH